MFCCLEDDIGFVDEVVEIWCFEEVVIEIGLKEDIL